MDARADLSFLSADGADGADGAGVHNEQQNQQELKSERAIELEEVIKECETREGKAKKHRSFWEETCQRRTRPLAEEMAAVDQKKQDAISELNAELERLRRVGTVPPPGPKALSWVEGDRFGALCNTVVALNLAAMGLDRHLHEWLGKGASWLNDGFLAWYTSELLLKLVYFQCTFLVGPVSVVWWNWMDLLIVVSGVIEQWVVPALASAGAAGKEVNLSALRCLRFLRLLRVLRVLKLVRAFVQGDFSWVQGSTYEAVGSVILALNSVTMAVELDTSRWEGWFYLNSVFLTYYTFDIACRMKYQGCAFFYARETLGWNYLDFIIVLEGVADQWIVPGVRSAQSAWNATARTGSAQQAGGGNQLGILKMLRLMRILRLARLCKSIPPLFKVMQGVAEALGGLRWVMILTILVLYASAIVFTTMVLDGMVAHSDDQRDLALDSFGTVPESLYSLFRIMNGDLEPAMALSDEPGGQLLLVGFVICSNWAILAILTSVVSDNMISSSASIRKKEQETAEEEKQVRARELLTRFFQEIDTDSSGTIEANEWESRVMGDRGMRESLCAVTSLEQRDLEDAFGALACSETAQRLKHIKFDEFMDYLLKDSRVPADRRSVLKVRSQLESLEKSQRQTSRQMALLASTMDSLSSKVDALGRKVDARCR